MSIKILTKNGVDVTNIDAARQFNFSAGMRSGIVKGAFNEGTLFASSNNTIALDTCELIISGHRVIIESVQSITLANAPSVNTKKSLFAEIVVSENSLPTFRLFVEPSTYNLRQDNLFKNNMGNGTYQIEIGTFLHKTDGTITDVFRTINIITGGYGTGGDSSVEDIEFNAIAVSLSSDSQPTVNIDYNEDTKQYDFTLGIPKGEKGDTPDMSDYLPLTGGTVTGDLNTNRGITVRAGQGIKLNSKDDTQFMLYGDGSTQAMYTQVKKSDGSYGYGKLMDTDTKLYSQNKEVLSVAGGTMEGDINLSTNRGFSATTTSGNTYDIFRVDSTNRKMTVGGTYPALELKGLNPKPTYNGNDMALSKDIPTFSLDGTTLTITLPE